MKTKDLLIAVSVIFIFTYTSNSQPIPQSQKKYGGLGYFSIGFTSLSTDNLNTQLTNAGYPELSGTMLSLGGGGHGMMGRWVFGGHGHSFIGMKEEHEEYELGLTMGYGFVDIGYTVYTSQNFDVYPIIGFGTGGMSLDITWDEPIDFNNILTDPQTSTEIIQEGFLMDLGITAQYLLNRSDNPLERGGLMLGIQFGWVIDPFENEWHINENEVSNGPDITMGGPYVRITLGGGGFNYQEIVD